MTTEPDDDPSEYDLVMPFVVCASKGGPYDDQAFVAGYEMGKLDAELPMQGALNVRSWLITVRTTSLPQVDLIAMRHGWTVQHVGDEIVEGWTSVDLVVAP